MCDMTHMNVRHDTLTVEDMPLGVVDATTVPNSDLVTFEVRYVDRTGFLYTLLLILFFLL